MAAPKQDEHGAVNRSPDLLRVHVFVSGRVQGVWFRESTRKMANRLGVAGWVRNLPDGRVEAVFEGPPEAVRDSMKGVCAHIPAARVLRRVVKQSGIVLLLFAALFGGRTGNGMDAPTQIDGPAIEPTDSRASLHAGRRERMVSEQIRARGITDTAVLSAMLRVPRHRFVRDRDQSRAYADHPIAIGHGQTISQPYIVALMTELAEIKPGESVLDIGTGSGYQAAILSEIVGRVFSIEIVEALAESARHRLESLGYEKIEVRAGDGYGGWPEHAPFDAIIVAAAPNKIPQPLVDQLAPGGRLVIPVGDFDQELVVMEKLEDGSVKRKRVIPVRFVLMTGEVERR